MILALAACASPEPSPEPAAGPTTTPTVPAPPTTEETTRRGRPLEASGPLVPPQPSPGDWLFAPDVVRAVDLAIDDVGLASLAALPEEWVVADLTVDGVAVAGIGVRLKGNGSFQPIDQKPSFKLDLNEYSDLEIDGLDDLVLNNLVSDPSAVRERLAYELYREVGIPAPRAVHVQVAVNGEPYGVYLLLEDADARFLERWFDDEDGPLFEIYDADFTVDGVAAFDHDGGPDDRAVPLALAEVLADPGVRLTLDAEPYLDVGSFAVYFGASSAIGQFDAYPYSFPGDDVFVYVDPSDGRIHVLPHGGDETFREPDRPVDYVYGLLASACLADPGCEDLWAQATWDAVAAADALDLDDRALDWLDALDPLLEADTRVPWTWAQHEADVDDLVTFIVWRDTDLEQMPGMPPKR